MGADDDADCVEHVFGLVELHPTSHGVDSVSTCQRCGAVAIEPGQAALADRRPPL